jgi:hypothetical protein
MSSWRPFFLTLTMGASLSSAAPATPGPRLVVIEQLAEEPCLGARAFAQQLEAHGQACEVKPGEAPASGETDTLTTWLTRDGADARLHASGGRFGAWDRELPRASCEAQREAAAVALLSLLDPMPLLLPPAAPPNPPEFDPPDTGAPTELGVRAAMRAFPDGRTGSSLRLQGRGPWAAPVLVELGGESESPLGPPGRPIRVAGVEAAVLWVPRRASREPWMRPRMGLELAAVRLDASALAATAVAWTVNPALVAGGELGLCGTTTCLSVGLGARVLLHREALRLDGVELAQTPLAALELGLALTMTGH